MKRLVAVLLAAALGCGGGESTITGSQLLAAGDFNVTVSAGTTPSFSWPSGNAVALTVNRLDASTVKQWEIFASNVTGGFPSPVRYGALVPGTSPAPATVLVSGVHYIVTVLQLGGRYGQQEFVP